VYPVVYFQFPVWIYVNSDIALFCQTPDLRSMMAKAWYQQQLPMADTDPCWSQHSFQMERLASHHLSTSLPFLSLRLHEANGGDWPIQALLVGFDFFFSFLFSQGKRCDKKSLLTIRTECQSCSVNFGMKCPDGYTKITNGTPGIRDCRYSSWDTVYVCWSLGN